MIFTRMLLLVAFLSLNVPLFSVSVGDVKTMSSDGSLDKVLKRIEKDASWAEGVSKQVQAIVDDPDFATKYKDDKTVFPGDGLDKALKYGETQKATKATAKQAVGALTAAAKVNEVLADLDSFYDPTDKKAEIDRDTLVDIVNALNKVGAAADPKFVSKVADPEATYPS